MAGGGALPAPDLIMEGGSWVLISFFWIDSARWYSLEDNRNKYQLKSVFQLAEVLKLRLAARQVLAVYYLKGKFWNSIKS